MYVTSAFLFPHQKTLLSAEETVSHIKSELRAFENLAHEWLVKQTRAHLLLFTPESVGSH